MSLVSVLTTFGLTEKQAKVYLTLLELSRALPSTISRKSGIKRPTVYVILEQLQEMGLAGHLKKGKNLYFTAVDPQALVEDQERRLQVLNDHLPELKQLKQKYQVTPQMTILEGREGIIQIMEDTLTTSGEILCWSNADLAVNTFLKDYHPTYLKKKIKKKIWTKCLFLQDQMGLRFKERSDVELREVYLIPRDKFFFENEINIYDDKVSIISHKDNVGMIIQNQAIADTQRAIFNFAFEYAKLLAVT